MEKDRLDRLKTEMEASRKLARDADDSMRKERNKAHSLGRQVAELVQRYRHATNAFGLTVNALDHAIPAIVGTSKGSPIATGATHDDEPTASEAVSALKQIRMHLQFSFFGAQRKSNEHQALWSEVAPVEVKSLSKSASAQSLPAVRGATQRPASRWATSDADAINAEKNRFKAGLQIDPSPTNPPSRAIVPVKATMVSREGERLSTPRLESIVAQFTADLTLPEVPMQSSAMGGGALSKKPKRRSQHRENNAIEGKNKAATT